MATNHEVVGSNPTGQVLKTAFLTAFRKTGRFLLGESCHHGDMPVTCF